MWCRLNYVIFRSYKGRFTLWNRIRSGHIKTKYKNCFFNRNPMERTESIHTGRTGPGQVRGRTSWITQGGNFCPLPQASRLLSPFPMTAEVTSAARKPKRQLDCSHSTAADILPVFGGVCAQSLNQCMRFTVDTPCY
jgi:hypothetical protein